MSIVQLQDLGHQFFKGQDQTRGAPPRHLCASDYRVYLSGFPSMDHAAHEQFARAFYAGFPDLQHTIERTVVDGNQVAVHFTITGTHLADFMGIPATGCSVTVAAMAFLQLKDGKVSRIHGLFDQLGLLRQLGAMG